MLSEFPAPPLPTVRAVCVGAPGALLRQFDVNPANLCRVSKSFLLKTAIASRVPFDNNEVERAIRMPKLKQEVGGCFRTSFEADTFCAIRAYLATFKKQGQDLFDTLVRASQGLSHQPCVSG